MRPSFNLFAVFSRPPPPLCIRLEVSRQRDGPADLGDLGEILMESMRWFTE